MMNQTKSNLTILIIGAIITFLLLLVLNLVILFNQFTDKQIEIATFITSLLIFFSLGFVSGNLKTKNGLVNGILMSAILIVIFVIISLFTKSLQYSHIVRYIIMLLTGGFGGVIGVNFKPLVK